MVAWAEKARTRDVSPSEELAKHHQEQQQQPPKSSYVNEKQMRTAKYSQNVTK
jgi:hypothetical protein